MSCGPAKEGFPHKAGSCAGCPQGHGEAWCGGDCEWRDGECKDKVEVALSDGRKKREQNDNIASTSAVASTTGPMTSWESLPDVDVFLNPARQTDIREAEEYILNMTRWQVEEGKNYSIDGQTWKMSQSTLSWMV